MGGFTVNTGRGHECSVQPSSPSDAVALFHDGYNGKAVLLGADESDSMTRFTPLGTLELAAELIEASGYVTGAKAVDVLLRKACPCGTDTSTCDYHAAVDVVTYERRAVIQFLAALINAQRYADDLEKSL